MEKGRLFCRVYWIAALCLLVGLIGPGLDGFAAAADKPKLTVWWNKGYYKEEDEGFTASNGQSWLRCRAVVPGGGKATVSSTPVGTHRLSFVYPGKAELTLVHLLEIGDQAAPRAPAPVAVAGQPGQLQITVAGHTCLFAAEPPYVVSVSPRK